MQESADRQDVPEANLESLDQGFARTELARALVKNAPWLLILSSLGTTLVVLLLWDSVGATELLAWWTIVALVNAHGIFHAYRARRSGEWVGFLPHYNYGALVAGLCWGLGVAYFFLQVPQPQQVALIGGLFLVASATLAGNNPSFPAAAAFLVTLITPTLGAAVYFDAVFYRELATGLLLLLVVFLRFGYVSARALTANAILLSRVERLARTLTRTNEKLTTADAAKTRFLAAASHDLRQPMHAIGLLIGALRQQVSTPEATENVRRITAAVDGLTSLFDAILDISKLDAGVVKPRQENFPVSRILDSLSHHYLIRAQQKKLDMDVVPSSVIVRSDPALLSQICQNLVSNAIRYTESGRILIGVRRRAKAAEIQVWDTGIGIPGHQVSKIFEEFVQLSNPTHDRTKGLGLGLSIVERTANLLGHRVTVHSRLGKGSCFSITVPSESGRKPSYDPDAESSDRDVAERLDGAFIVIVDDEEDVLHAMTALLRVYGCHTVAATSAGQLTEALREHERQPDLIITDFRIGPSETGFDVIDKVREMQELKIPALIITGSQSSEYLKTAMTTGARVLGKPLNERQLIHAISEALGRAEHQTLA